MRTLVGISISADLLCRALHGGSGGRIRVFEKAFIRLVVERCEGKLHSVGNLINALGCVLNQFKGTLIPEQFELAWNHFVDELSLGEPQHLVGIAVWKA